jgi:acetolactate synthase-1/2/3 large subunit
MGNLDARARPWLKPGEQNMTRMTGARCLAETLSGYGVSHVFMVPAVLRRTMAEIERRTGIQCIHTHGEKSAVYMADGFARASGRPGVCMAQQVGALNLAAGLRDPWLASSPVIAMTGGSRPDRRFRGLYQEAEDLPAFEQYTKWNASVDTVERFPDMLRQAFRVATSGSPGPVHLQFQGQEGEIDRDEADLDVVVEEAFRRVPPFRPLADPHDVARTLSCIAAAERPVIVAGGGARHSDAGAALRELAHRLQVPVATSLNGRELIPDSDPLSVGVVGTYSRRSANQVVHEADLVIFVGSRAGSMVTNFWQLPPAGTAVIQVDIDPTVIGRNYPVEVGINADARSALESMLAATGEEGTAPGHRAAWLERVRAQGATWRQERSALIASDNQPMRPERLCNELSRWLPEDALLVVDTGHAGMWMASMFELEHATQSFMRSAGHLGWAFPAGLGARCASPGRPVVTFTGDLGFWYHIGEVETAVRWGIDAITVVNNNHSGNQSKRGFDVAYEGNATERSRQLWVHNEVNFARIASEIGALGIRVEKPAELEPAFDQALSAGRPVVIDVATDLDALAPLAWTA